MESQNQRLMHSSEQFERAWMDLVDLAARRGSDDPELGETLAQLVIAWTDINQARLDERRALGKRLTALERQNNRLRRALRSLLTAGDPLARLGAEAPKKRWLLASERARALLG